MTSPTSGSASLPNVSGHGMSQSPSTPNSANGMGPGQGGFPNLNPAQMKALQMQRMMQQQQMNMGGGGGGGGAAWSRDGVE